LGVFVCEFVKKEFVHNTEQFTPHFKNDHLMFTNAIEMLNLTERSNFNIT